jgi:hypothetical protein
VKDSLTGASGEVLGCVTERAESQSLSQPSCPGAAQHEGARRRPRIVKGTEFGTIPDQRCTAGALHRIRETVMPRILTERASSPIVPAMNGLNAICGICREIIG